MIVAVVSLNCNTKMVNKTITVAKIAFTGLKYLPFDS